MAYKVSGIFKNVGTEVVRVYGVNSENEARYAAFADGIAVEKVEPTDEPAATIVRAGNDSSGLGIAAFLQIMGWLGIIGSVLWCGIEYVATDRPELYGVEQWPSPWPCVGKLLGLIVGCVLLMAAGRVIELLEKIAGNSNRK